jgi:ABC-type protease/lipase transport system fused ATPase/permease subunit
MTSAWLPPNEAYLSAVCGLGFVVQQNDLVVLDEPNSNLDVEGEAAVGAAIAALKARGAIAVVIAHRPSAIAAVDLILVVREGEAAAFGPKEEVLAKTVQNARQILGRPAQRADGRVLQGAD